MTKRPYDILLYGAGGFTGRQTVAYFAEHAPAGLRWAVAGPRRKTLEAAIDEAGARHSNIDVVVAPSQDQEAVDAVVSRSRCVLSTAGPFALYGTPVVDACVRFRTHYVDITGETPWMAEIARRYHTLAVSNGTRIVLCCGFDSVPSDLGVMLMVRYIRETLGVPCAEVRSYFQFSGGLNGGTVASLLNMMNMRGRSAAEATPTHRDSRIRIVKAPRYDSELGTWIGPFVMAPTNTQVVRRSLSLFEEWQQSYGENFQYQEAMRYDPPFARLRATAELASLGLELAALKRPATRWLIRPLLPKPGKGPSVRQMDEGWFTCDLLGIGADGRQARGLIGYTGDPGNRATTVFLCESAFAIATDADALPGGPARGGVLTPATGLGDALVRRLRAAGVVISIPVATPTRQVRIR